MPLPDATGFASRVSSLHTAWYQRDRRQGKSAGRWMFNCLHGMAGHTRPGANSILENADGTQESNEETQEGQEALEHEAVDHPPKSRGLNRRAALLAAYATERSVHHGGRLALAGRQPFISPTRTSYSETKHETPAEVFPLDSPAAL